MNLVIPNSYSDRCEPKFTNSAQPGIWKMKWNDMARGAMKYELPMGVSNKVW